MKNETRNPRRTYGDILRAWNRADVTAADSAAPCVVADETASAASPDKPQRADHKSGLVSVPVTPMGGTRKTAVDVGETCLTAYLCDGDSRANLVRECAAGRSCINPDFYTLADMEAEAETARAAMTLALVWGYSPPPEQPPAPT